MKTYSNYISENKAKIDESVTALASWDADKVAGLPECPKSDKDIAKLAPAGYKMLERKAKALGCTIKMAYILMYNIQGKIGGSTNFDIEVPRSSKTNFWIRVNEKTNMFGFKEDFMKLSMYAQIQPELMGKDIDDAVKEIGKVRDFVQWFNAQDPANIFPVFQAKL